MSCSMNISIVVLAALALRSLAWKPQASNFRTQFATTFYTGDTHNGPAAPVSGVPTLVEALRVPHASVGVGVMSCMINLLYLTGSIFMLEVYDRCCRAERADPDRPRHACGGPSTSRRAVLVLIRGRILGRIGTSLDKPSIPVCLTPSVRLPLTRHGQPQRRTAAAARSRQRALVPRRHGAGCVFDLPWLPFTLRSVCVPLADRRHCPGRRPSSSWRSTWSRSSVAHRP